MGVKAKAAKFGLKAKPKALTSLVLSTPELEIFQNLDLAYV